MRAIRDGRGQRRSAGRVKADSSGQDEVAGALLAQPPGGDERVDHAVGRAAADPDEAGDVALAHGLVAVEGWAQTSMLSAEELGRRFEDAGVAAIIYTDIARDGVLKGLNIEATLALARAVSIPVIASGGLASMADIERLAEPDCAILGGAITGRALYDGRIDPATALARLAGNGTEAA